MKPEKLIRILAGAAVVIFLGYFAISVYRSSGNNYKTSTAYVQTVSATVDADMYIIREEQIITSDSSGVVVSLAQNGGKVAGGSEIAAIFRNEKDAENYSNALSLKKKLETYKKIEGQVRLANLDLGKLNGEIDRNFFSMLDAVYYNDYLNLSSDELTFSENFSRKNISLGYDVDCSAQIEKLEKQIAKLTAVKPSGIITTDIAGYYVSRPDGFESTLTADKIDELTAEELEKALKADKGKIPKNAIGKVINGFEWYAACIVPSERLTGIEVGKRVQLMLGDSDRETIWARLYSKELLDKGKCLAVFKCSDMNEELSGLRKASGKIILREYTGIKIRKDAVRFNDKNEAGVYIKEGNLIKFNRIEEIYSDENFVIAQDKSGTPGWLAQYDEIVISGKELANGKVID